MRRSNLARTLAAVLTLGATGLTYAFSLHPLTRSASHARHQLHSWVSPARPSLQRSSTAVHASSVAAEGSSRSSGNVGSSSSSSPPYAMNVQQNVYLVLTNWFVTCLIAADVIGVKIFNVNFFGREIHHTCGMVSFPITFLLSDIINEYYGPAATKKTVYLGLVMSIFVFGVINVAQALPYLNKPFNVTPAAFNMIFGSAKVMYVASILAYLIGQLTDIWLYSFIKRVTKGKLLWLRAAVSTMVSQMLDSFVVSYVAYGLGKTLTGQIPATMKEVFEISTTGYGLKFFIAAIITPLLYVSRDLLESRFGLQPMPIDAVEAEGRGAAKAATI